MTEPIADNAFIVISGHHPDTGKKERISRVRAHITSRYFRNLQRKQQKTKAEQTRTVQKLVTPFETDRHYWHQHGDHPQIGDELLNPVHVAGHALLHPTSFTAETTRRIQKFFGLHLRGYVASHPFYRDVIRWAISEPHFLSAKLLNASGWDDILEQGELSIWTTQQRLITMRLLNDALTNEIREESKYSTIAAIQSLLAFELLIGNNQNIHRLKAFYESLISRSIEVNNEVWIFLTRGHFMLCCADRLRRASDNNNYHKHGSNRPSVLEQNLDPDPSPEHQFAFPVDMSLFTLSQSGPAEDYHHMSAAVCDLYDILSITARSQVTPLTLSTYEHVVSSHKQLTSYIASQGLTNMGGCFPPINSTVANGLHVAALRICTFILTSYLLSNHDEEQEDQIRNLAKLVSQLRALLNSAASELHSRVSWMPFPGALVWCHAIGLRFADPQCDRTWFLMQFLRVAHLCALETWKETSKSMELIVYSLVCIRRVSVESRGCHND